MSTAVLEREIIQSAPPVCLDPARTKNPFSLVSLWDIMNHFMVWQLTKTLDMIREREDTCRLAVANGIGTMIVSEDERKAHRDLLAYSRDQFMGAELQSAVERIDGPFRIALLRPVSYQTLHTEFRVLRESAQAELHYRRFAFVPTSKARILDNKARDWEPVWLAVPDAKIDSVDAVECYALDKNTACVFHLMRVAEHCLRVVARRLKVTLTHKGKPEALEFAVWDKIITGCNNKIQKAHAMARSPKAQAQLELFSDAAQHCTFMKDIWRNNVSHARDPYIESEALTVMTRVRDFAVFVATKIV